MRFIVAYILMFISIAGYSQSYTCDSKDQQKVEGILNAAQVGNWDKLTVGEQFDSISSRLIGIKYVAKTLESDSGEKLVINLTGLDCTTFVETVFGLFVTINKKEYNFDSYAQNLTQIRYRNGNCEDYTSRLHYFTEWLDNNSKSGRLVNKTEKIGGVPYNKTINFMSGHRSSYTALKEDSLYNKIKSIEGKIAGINKYYIPKSKVKSIEKDIKTGNIIGITTSIGGLDIVHMGFAIVKNNRIHLLHASSDFKKVMVSEEPLFEYLAKHKIQTGIIVAEIKKSN